MGDIGDLDDLDDEFSVEMSEVVLTRRLDRNGEPVTVQVGRPVLFEEEGSDCYVPYRIEGLGGKPFIFMAGGVDDVQAMTLALTMIGDKLAQEEGLTFLGDANLGFPTSSVEPGSLLAIMRTATE